MGWGDHNFTAKPYIERLKSIAEKLKKIQDANLDADKNRLKNLLSAIDAVNKVRERKQDDLGEKTTIATISSRASEHRRQSIAARYKRRGNINNS